MEGLFHQILDGLPDVDRLVEGHAQLHAGRNADHLRQLPAQRVHHFHRIGGRLFVDPQVDGALAVGADDVGLDVGRIGDGAQVPHTNRVAQGIHLHDHVVERLDRLELIVRKDVVIEIARLQIAGGQDEVRGLDGLDDVQDREPAGLQERGVQVDVDLADLPALDRRGGDVVDLLDLRGDGVVGQVVERALVEVAAGDGDQRHGNVRDVELDDEGLQNAGRQIGLDLRHPLHHFHLADVDVRAPIEPDLNRPDAVLGEGFHVLDVRGRADGLFDGVDDALFDVEGRRALIDDADEGDGHLDVRKEVDRQAVERGPAQDDHRQGEHQNPDAVAQREEGQPHLGSEK